MRKIIITLFVGLFVLVTTSINVGASLNNNWMSKIDDSKYLSEISIPGTHDTAALYEPISGTAKCQNLTLEEQLNAGIRYIDIRCRSYKDSFEIYHGAIYQKLNFDDVINTCTNFLSDNPTETIIMSVKEEYNPLGSIKTFEEILKSYLEKNKSIWLLNDRIHQLGEVRGKIVLLRRFSAKETPLGIDASNWQDNTTFDINNSANLTIQDCYKVSDNSDKWAAITNLYSQAKSSAANNLYINYTSGYQSKFLIPNITSVSNYINPKLINYFNENTSGNFGISVVDFIDEDISSAIISTNFR